MDWVIIYILVLAGGLFGGYFLGEQPDFEDQPHFIIWLSSAVWALIWTTGMYFLF